MPAVASDRQVRADLDRSIRSPGLYADHRTARPDQVGRFGIHQDLERGKPLAALAQEIEKVPLRHEGNEGVIDLETAEIRDSNRSFAEFPVHLLQSLVRKFQEPVDQAEFVHHLKRGGMHRVATGAPQQISQHHAGGATADDAASGVYRAPGRSLWSSARVHDLALVIWALSAGNS